MTSATACGDVQFFGSTSGMSSLFRGVSITFGRTAFTRIAGAESSADKASTSRATPDLAAAYGPKPAPAGSADFAPMSVMLPPSRKSGKVALIVETVVRTFDEKSEHQSAGVASWTFSH